MVAVHDFLREIGLSALKQSDQEYMFRTLKRVLRLFHHFSQSERQLFSFSKELNTLLNHKEEECGGGNRRHEKVLELIHFMAQEAPPSVFLEAFQTWTSTHEWPEDTVKVLQMVLKRGTRAALTSELSGSLLRLRRARQRMKSGFDGAESTYRQKRSPSTKDMQASTVWKLMSQGLVAIEK